MADAKISALSEATTFAAGTDLIPIVHDAAGTAATKKMTETNLVLEVSRDITRERCWTVPNPNAYYTNVRAQVVLFRASAAITITRIHIQGPDSTPTTELAGDLKYADDILTGGFANAVVIDVCDTTSGAFTATSSFDDATVPSGKYVYFLMDAAPHVDWKDFYIEVYYTYD
jgi:hypothetical protein